MSRPGAAWVVVPEVPIKSHWATIYVETEAALEDGGRHPLQDYLGQGAPLIPAAAVVFIGGVPDFFVTPVSSKVFHELCPTE